MEVAYTWLGFSISWRHMKLYKDMFLNAHYLHFCPTVLFLSAYTYDHLGNSPYSVDRRREDLSQVDRWFCRICRCHSKVDSCSTITSFWDNPEGQWWRNILEMDRTLSSEPGKLCDPKIWGRRVDGPFRIGKKCKYVCVPYECSPKGDISRGF